MFTSPFLFLVITDGSIDSTIISLLCEFFSQDRSWLDDSDSEVKILDDRQIHHPAIANVKFPTSVIAACTVTTQFSEVGLSKKCQVQAHIALTNAGSIPNESDRQARFPLTSA